MRLLKGYWIEALLTLLGLFYVAYRLINVPLGPDEWGVLAEIHHHSFIDMFTFEDFHDWNAQSQFLNLFASRICFQIFSFNELWRIRIPSLTAFLIYLGTLWRIRARFSKRSVGVLTFAALLSNAFILDFFSVSRGYGLSLAFAMWSLAMLLDLASDGQVTRGGNWRVQVVMWSGVLAVLSNFAFLYFYVSAMLAVLLLWWTSHPGCRTVRRMILDNLYLGEGAIVLFVFYLPRVQQMVEGHLLYFGGTQGFVADTIASLVQCTDYNGGMFYPSITTLGKLVCAWTVMALVGVLVLESGIKARNIPVEKSYGWLRGWVISFCVLAIMAMIFAGHAVGVRFPVERAALYFIPMFVLQVACCADCFHWKWGDLRLPLLMSVLLIYTVVAVHGANLTHTCIGPAMADVPELVRKLEMEHEQTGRPIILCVSDGIKWNVWYYAELATGTKQSDRLEDHGGAAQFDWLWVYEMNSWRDRPEKRSIPNEATHFFAAPEDDLQAQTAGFVVLAVEYPVSHWRLYER